MERMRRHIFSTVLALMLSFTSFAGPGQPLRILSIDGGGVRGIISAIVLARIEKDLNKPISEIFDWVTGTSIGGVIALSLTLPTKSDKPCRAVDVVNFMVEESPEIFTASFWHRVTTLNGLIGPRYESDRVAALFAKIFGDKKFSQAIIPTLITGYYVEGECGIEFFSEDARIDEDCKDCLVHELACATSAAPTYFDSVIMHFPWGELGPVVDGGLYKQNPALLAYANAKKRYPDRKVEIYSIGTGITAAEEQSPALTGRGIIHWASPILVHLNNGSIDADDTVLHKLLNNDDEESYFRIDVRLEDSHKAMDNISEDNLSYLFLKGVEATSSPIYQRMLEQLKKNIN